MKILEEREWKPLMLAHESRVDPWCAPRLDRMSRGERHPVDDFLFEYYPNRPSLLRRWHPGLGIALKGAEAYSAYSGYITTPIGVTAEPVGENRRTFVEWLYRFLTLTAHRPPFFGCHGIHEWAMVYKTEENRYEDLPLRLSPQEIATVVDALPVRCSHYDAFRFFTPPARPLNRLQPVRETSPDLDQPGCLHANMDLYKWAFKLAPWCPSELMADAFELAREIRTLDMQASPYDLSAYGYEAVPIETATGRVEYERLQRGFAQRAIPIRKKLLTLCEALLMPEQTDSLPVTAL